MNEREIRKKMGEPSSLPIVVHPRSKKIKKCTGYFNGFCVEVRDPEEMRILSSNGCFGKGSLSRSYPHYDNEDVSIIRQRQFKNRRKIAQMKTFKKVLVLPDSDEDDPHHEEYFTNIQGVYELDYSCLKEMVYLMLEEAFFLSAEIKCLDVLQEGIVLEFNEMWRLFGGVDPLFIVNYVVYYYYRSKNWVVMSGVKYGGDYVIYRKGPAFYHSKSVILIDVLNEKLERIERFVRRSLDAKQLMGENRTLEAVTKETIICQVIWPENCEESNVYLNLKGVEIRELMLDRWVPNKERNNDQSNA